jgi:predicted RND superfamily exporter protein
MGDIAEGAAGVILFFGVAFLITAILLYWYSGSFVLTALSLLCALASVIWLLGLLPVFGLGLDPLSILVPFLIFSIAVSHAVQMTNAWKLETLHGADGVTASTNAFQQLFIPGATALITDGFGFMAIAFVEIEIVRELVYAAAIGVTVMIITNKVMLPILLSTTRSRPSRPRSSPARDLGRLVVGATRAARHAPLGVAADPRGRRPGGLRHLAGAQPAHWRPRQGRAGTQGGLALQPGRRDDRESLLDRSGQPAGHCRGQGRGRRTRPA